MYGLIRASKPNKSPPAELGPLGLGRTKFPFLHFQKSKIQLAPFMAKLTGQVNFLFKHTAILSSSNKFNEIVIEIDGYLD